MNPRRAGTGSFQRFAQGAGIGSVALVIGLLAVGSPSGNAATPPSSISLTQTWLHTLDDAPCGLAESSPVEVTLDESGPSVEVGDREGDIYAFHLSNGTVPKDWSPSPPSVSMGSGLGCGVTGSDAHTARVSRGVNGIAIPGNAPIDSTASVASTPAGSFVYFGAGNAADPDQGGYYDYGANGHLQWSQVATNPPTDTQPDVGVQASPTLVTGDGAPFVVAGSLGQESDALLATGGATLTGWPFFSADTVFSTAAVADLYGTGQDELVVGGASTSGIAYGRHYVNGGHLRILNDHGGLICSANTNEEIDSSPAIGPILAGGALGIATGTGSYFTGSDENTVKVFDTQCNQVWSKVLDGATGGSPALADVLGHGQLAVIEGTNINNSTGSVWALNAATGATIWKVPALGAVIGSVTTADLSSSGAQDVIVATTRGLEILNGKNGAELVHVDDGSHNGHVTTGEVYGFQNAPLVTDDPGGSIGITVAGYFAVPESPNHDVQGMVQHFAVGATNGALVSEPGGWPQFHHDPELSGFAGTSAGYLTGCQIPPAASDGYLMAAADGGVFTYGEQSFCGNAVNTALTGPVVGIASTPDRGGYWLASANGGVFSFGLPFYGSAGGTHLNRSIVGMAATPDGLGYWLVGADGGIFAFGDAQFYGSSATVAHQHVVGMASSPDGQGYWEVNANGTVAAFGDAGFFGDVRHLHLVAPIVGMTPDPVTGGYWLIASNGGVFSFNAPFLGTAGTLALHRPIVGMVATDDGNGYWIVAADGGVFAYGDAPYQGSASSTPLNGAVVGIAGF